MQVFFRFLGCRPRLDGWEQRPFSPGAEAGPGGRDHRDVYTRQVAREDPGPPAVGGAHRRLAAAIGRYEIFPPQRVSGVLRRIPVVAGDTVGIWYHGPGGVDLFFAARVTETFDGPAEGIWRSGFTYRTLRGHPELGEETFAVEKDLVSGSVRVVLRSWSRPGTRLARAFSSIVRQLQVQASHAALDHLSRVAAG